MKTVKASSEAGEGPWLAKTRLSPWTQEVSTAFAHLSKPQRWGLARLPRRQSASRSSGSGPSQCSALGSVGGTGSQRLSPLPGVVSGSRAEKWEKAAGTRRRDVFWVLTELGGALDSGAAGREGSPGFGSGCHPSAQSVDDPGHQRVRGRMCYSSRLEGASRRAGRVVAASTSKPCSSSEDQAFLGKGKSSCWPIGA
jgi:hypothetical protein